MNMQHRSAAALTACLCLAAVAGFANRAAAETIAVDTGIAVKDPGIPTPTRGMTMDEVIAKFGAPTSKLPPVGRPPIARWEYAGFVVYFEFNHVVHTVVAG